MSTIVDLRKFRDRGRAVPTLVLVDLHHELFDLFEVGASGPPCALYGGLHSEARMKTMEEALRFYHHFGLTLSEAARELPDHLSTQLEFLHFLAFREAEALDSGLDAGPYRRAQRDFVAGLMARAKVNHEAAKSTRSLPS